jgi:ABC-2 type transport system ATP-binding protein
MSVTPVVEFEGVVKDYPLGLLRRQKLRAVDHVSLKILPGEVVGLLGPNRAGKTTLVKLLLSLARPTSGTVTRLGAPIGQRSTLARVGYVHENQAFPRYLTAVELLQMYGALSQLDEETVRQRAGKLLDTVGLDDRSREPISRFSKGMIQRLGLAQALINEPELLVLDEPAEGLDLLGRQLVHRIVAEQKRRGGSVLMVSHLTDDVAKLCDRVAVLVKGRLVFMGMVQELVGERTLDEALRPLYERN